MLLTCFKHDFKALSRTLVPALIGIAGAAVFGFLSALTFSLTEKSDAAQTGAALPGALNAAAVGSLIVDGMLLAAAMTVIVVLIFVRFYRSMVTDEAYLTFTLPVTPGRLIASKFLASGVWMLIGGAAVTAAGFVVAAGFEASDPFQLVRVFWYLIREAAAEVPLEFFLACLLLLISAVRSYFQITGAILFGASIVRRHKVLVSILLVLGVNFVVGMVLTVFGVATFFQRLYVAAYTDTVSIGAVTWLIVQCAVNALLAAAFWWVNVRIAKKSVNIE